jgi:hypothetical protein
MATRTPEQRREQEVETVLRALLRYYEAKEDPFSSVKAALDELKNAAPGAHALVFKVYVMGDQVTRTEKQAAGGKLHWFVRRLPTDLDLRLPAKEDEKETPSLGDYGDQDTVEAEGEERDWSSAEVEDFLYGDTRIEERQRASGAHIGRWRTGYRATGKKKVMRLAQVY